MISEEQIGRARAVPIQSVITRRCIKLKKIASNEFAGPCPKCGGDDRFSINTVKNIWNCHGCSKGGDIIELGVHLGESFENSVEDLIGPAVKANGHSKPKANGASKPRAEKDKDKDEDEDEDIRRNKDPAGTYDYLDATGALAVQVLRFHWDHGADGSSVLKANGKLKKTFSQRRPDPDEAKLLVVGVTAGEYLRRGPGHDWDRFSGEKWAGLPAATRQRKTIADSVKAVPARLNHRELDKCAPARSPVAGLEPDRVPPITR